MNTDLIASTLILKREELDELERFVGTPSFGRLMDEIGPFIQAPEPWLINWLICPLFGEDVYPLTLARQADGVEALAERLRRIVHGTGV